MDGRFVVVVVWVVGFWWVVGFVGGEFMEVVGNVWVLSMVTIGIVVAVSIVVASGWQCVGLLDWEGKREEIIEEE